MSQLFCYLVCLLAAVGHFLNGHHLIVPHISGLSDDKLYQCFKRRAPATQCDRLNNYDSSFVSTETSP